jgi:hypothetical protein
VIVTCNIFCGRGAFGLLIDLEIQFEASASGEINVIESAAQKSRELFEAVYPTYEILGWYSVGDEVLYTDTGDGSIRK